MQQRSALYQGFDCRALTVTAVLKGVAWMLFRKGLTQQSRVVVGIPMLTSTGNLRFWLHLCKAASNDGAAQLVQEFQGREGDKAEMARFTHAYNQSLIDRVCVPLLLFELGVKTGQKHVAIP